MLCSNFIASILKKGEKFLRSEIRPIVNNYNAAVAIGIAALAHVERSSLDVELIEFCRSILSIRALIPTLP